MIDKNKLSDFIDKYYLAGNVDSVRIAIDGNDLSTTFISDDQNVVGTVIGKNIVNDLEDGELGVYDTSKLIKMLSVLDTEISIKQEFEPSGKTAALKISDESTSVTFMLADLGVFKSAPKTKSLPNFDVTITITKEFMQKFLKAKSGMPEAENFAVISDGNETSIVLNFATINTNRINFPVKADSAKSMTPTCFSANIFKEILSANKGMQSATLEVSQSGLAKVTFSDSDFTATYFLLKINVI